MNTYRFNIKVIFILVFCLMHVTVARASNGYNEDSWYTKFVNSIGQSIYYLAWPTASYRGIQLQNVIKKNGRIYYVVAVYGLSGFDQSSLWSQVVLETYNGEISDLRWGDHNALISPPGQTIATLGEALKEINRSNKIRSQKNNIYHVACLKNDSGNSVNFKIKWGAGEWESVVVKDGYYYSFSNQLNKNLYIEFDNDYSTGYQITKYKLPTFKSRKKSCDGINNYKFNSEGSKLNLYKT